jgi:hypothetical protein
MLAIFHNVLSSHKHLNVQTFNFTCCLVWLWHFLSPPSPTKEIWSRLRHGRWGEHLNVAERWRKRHIEELRNLYPSLNIINILTYKTGGIVRCYVTAQSACDDATKEQSVATQRSGIQRLRGSGDVMHHRNTARSGVFYAVRAWERRGKHTQH